MPSNHLILCHPLLLLPSIFPSIRVFSNKSVLRIRWPKYWSVSFNISPSNEHSGLISFRMDWFDLLAVQGTLKSHLQHHSSKASILQCSAFFMVQLLTSTHDYWKNHSFDYDYDYGLWTFVSKVMSLLFNMLSIFVSSLSPIPNHNYNLSCTRVYQEINDFYLVFPVWPLSNNCAFYIKTLVVVCAYMWCVLTTWF